MKIKEVSKKTELSQKTIRVYEAAGLIHPRTENINGRIFRDYTQTDVENLKEIAILRKARFSIDEILRMLENPENFQEVYAGYYDRIKQETEEMERLLAVLNAISTHTMQSPKELVREIQDVSNELSLPPADVHPHFRYIDLLEEKLKIKDTKKRKKPIDQKCNAAIIQGASLPQYQTKTGVRDGSMSGTSVLMTMRMLDDGKDEKR